ncbi:transmembrane 4 L6 family member 19 isoform X1 [Centrocercus urophasianus]|uniref:transmembrane 4 L6 family member 19 isoform X1 n=2 Tax=Centrocercus urophasianus TaxID=9002 RepID=UPI001C6480FD|nr:transmembrane 4 L6 family member 19 isoform X1 [Centrocercus urophasianus]
METTTQHPMGSASAKPEPPPPLFSMQVGNVCREMQPHRGPLLAGAGHALRGGQHPAALPWRVLAVPGGWAHQQEGKDHARYLGRRHHGKRRVLRGLLQHALSKDKEQDWASCFCSPLSPQATFSFLQVLLAAIHITAVGWRCACCSDCGTRRNAFLSVVLSKLALLGSAACFFFSGLGLTDGPLCLYNTTELSNGLIWDYPFVDTPSNRALENFYLFYPSTWGTCLEPVGIVAWHVTFFSLLLLISAAEMVLTFLQIINGCAGCLCGFCERKEAGLSHVPGVR